MKNGPSDEQTDRNAVTVAQSEIIALHAGIACSGRHCMQRTRASRATTVCGASVGRGWALAEDDRKDRSRFPAGMSIACRHCMQRTRASRATTVCGASVGRGWALAEDDRKDRSRFPVGMSIACRHCMQRTRALRATTVCCRSRWSRLGACRGRQERQKQIPCGNDNKNAKARETTKATARALLTTDDLLTSGSRAAALLHAMVTRGV